MKKSVITAVVLMVSITGVGWVNAQDPEFVENSDDIVRQMLDSRQSFRPYFKTRGPAIEEFKVRSIQVHAKNAQGQEQTVVVKVPDSNIEQGARLKIEFDVNSANLRATAYPLLAELGKALRDERVVDHKVCIKGHTDSDGDDSYNMGLSYARANAVQSFLEASYGIAADRLQVFGYGESKPLYPNDSALNKQANRRVEVSLNCPEIN